MSRTKNATPATTAATFVRAGRIEALHGIKHRQLTLLAMGGQVRYRCDLGVTPRYCLEDVEAYLERDRAAGVAAV